MHQGKWFAPLIDNPDYKGPWAPRKIANKDYFEDLTPSDFTKIAGVGFELWSMTDDILFDNVRQQCWWSSLQECSLVAAFQSQIYIGTSESDAARFATETFQAKYAVEQAAEKAADAVAESAAKSKEGLHDDSLAPDYKSQPLAFAQYKMQKFMDLAVEDPIEAVKQRPVEGAAAATLFATVLGFLTVCECCVWGFDGTVLATAADTKSALLISIVQCSRLFSQRRRLPSPSLRRSQRPSPPSHRRRLTLRPPTTLTPSPPTPRLSRLLSRPKRTRRRRRMSVPRVSGRGRARRPRRVMRNERLA